MTRNKKAFTLIELLIVVAIIGILAAIAVPNFLNAQTRAKIARVVSDLKSITKAIEMYYIDNNSYICESESYISMHDVKPHGEAGLYFLVTPVSYMSSIPLDPFENKYATASGTTGLDMYEVAVAPANPEPIKKFYNINSRGPDQDEDMGARSNLQNGTTVRTYFPSNGLYSDGDIYLWGGDASVMKGGINVDGKQYNQTMPPNPEY
ncbi:prepilin-type N-terminal cleavage/methylation domain-containing protein [bacterium]|nr:prepilin-type N-terminal cleavage/methylation domain-containing protein [bacterium]